MTTILFFGKISDVIGSQITYKFSDSSLNVGQLRSQLSTIHECPELNDLTIRVSVNDELVAETDMVKPIDTIAFLSPFSGG
ncbi:MoaD/ThiS family protein [Hirschia baltica]|uniref:ThiamineS protein n=1 Tax=Hirschia baltica (strain ATCC 49814 / DSM 5838 / IFAM 1418) TaxID=582402 RepID=C6XJL5_HIRBI|nr:MoaD/ThiS family protein [Hirschia baltica]ACT59310.1 thiamineS protein [Hirschia baltica ATCC 49814]